ncbi:MAG TPA: sialidase family protein [Kiritimatiellia bacterium]|nr:sialidase family protein [Kiritimatiellia bacterium]
MNAPDLRHLPTGLEIPTLSYSDQPYIVQTDDGAWLCCVTTGPGEEGERGQHVTTMRSTDRGRTWSAPVPVEDANSPENSYAVMLKNRDGRIYIFYNHNTDNVREVHWHDRSEASKRVDSLGYFVFKFSDDHGRSWSPRRYVIPVREFACDRENVYAGKIRLFWNVGKPFERAGAAYVPFIKVGKMGADFFAQSEGALLKSDNLLTEPDPARIRWETLPDGDVGLRTPPGGGPISEEQSYCVMSDGSLYVVYRSIDGHPVEAYSRDGGHTWSTPRYKRYADGRLMKHPRAANFAWRCRNGNYLYWFHNHGGRTYDDRNPVWLSGGQEVQTPHGLEIAWSQPEIVLYDDDPYVRMSYPDLIEEEGRYFLTETQKDVARVHEIPAPLLNALWAPEPPGERAHRILALPESNTAMPATCTAPVYPQFLKRDVHRADYGRLDLRAGFTLMLSLRLTSDAPGQVLLDSRTRAGKGLAVVTGENGAVELILNDGQTEQRGRCESGLLRVGAQHEIGIIVDGGPKLILFVVDGRLCDGAEQRQFGWARFSPHLREVNGDTMLHIHPDVTRLNVYAEALHINVLAAAQRQEQR